MRGWTFLAEFGIGEEAGFMEASGPTFARPKVVHEAAGVPDDKTRVIGRAEQADLKQGTIAGHLWAPWR